MEGKAPMPLLRPKASRLARLLPVLVFAACSGDHEYSPTAPQSPAPTPPPSAAAVDTYWDAESTVVAVSSTRNGCTESVVGQTSRGYLWQVRVILERFEARNTGENPFYPFTGVSPHVYNGTIDGRHFTAIGTGQDGGFECFVWSGDLAGTFSEDGKTFEAVENIEYHHYGEDPMRVQRRWTATRK